ncbi:hypothetical protein GSI_11887 [Ganoderma sinense ZZ0214-1]|uniref:Uncharacterized protein n=1 Tax=Ganoderma sinense ZZ0214-1 TaxID=1077348 RepID=A0A2G8RXA3_9APHY|nr:hypothetical protein GSI_11887 [Ganoderma sinense ZZ0214-1]
MSVTVNATLSCTARRIFDRPPDEEITVLRRPSCVRRHLLSLHPSCMLSGPPNPHLELSRARSPRAPRSRPSPSPVACPLAFCSPNSNPSIDVSVTPTARTWPRGYHKTTTTACRAYRSR